MSSEFFFNIQQSKAWQALLFDRIFQIKKARILRKAFQWILLVLCTVFVVGFFGKTIPQETLSLTLGGIFLSFALVGTFFLLESFGKYLKIMKAQAATENLADALSFESAKTLWH